MKDIVEGVRAALRKDLEIKPSGEIVEWNDQNPGESLNLVSRESDLNFKGWGMKVDEQTIAQAMLTLPVGTLVIDLEADPFFETDHRTVRIDSETDRTIIESDASYALSVMWPNEADAMEKMLSRIGMEIVPEIRGGGAGAGGSLTYSRNAVRQA